jgi:hypothetical protein
MDPTTKEGGESGCTSYRYRQIFQKRSHSQIELYNRRNSLCWAAASTVIAIIEGLQEEGKHQRPAGHGGH